MEGRLIAQIFGSSGGAAATASQAGTALSDFGLTILLKFIGVLEGVAVIVAGIFVMRLAKRYFLKIETTHERQKTALNLLEKITSGFIIVVSVTLGLKVIGLDLTLIVSVLTLGASFGMRDVIKNYVAGLLILFKSPFEIGDVVKIRSFTGRIEKIEFQSITLRTFDNKEITVHNSDLLTQPITNFSKNNQRRIEVTVRLGYGSDVARALLIFDRILGNNPAVLKMPKYSVVFKGFGETSTTVLIRFWVQRPCNILKIRSGLALQIQEAFDEEKIFAPYAREASLNENYAMTSARKERLSAFYGQPMLADIAGATSAQVALATVPAEETADAEEPEVEEF